MGTQRRLGIVAVGVFLLCACARKHGESSGAAGAPAAVSGGAPDASEPVDPNAHVGAKAVVTLSPVSPSDGGTQVGGNGTFSETTDGVDLDLYMHGCAPGDADPVAILAGGDCSAETLLGAHWDSPRGDGLTALMCVGTTGGGRDFYTRAKADAKAWTIGDPTASNLLGHALVIYDPDSLEPLACGVITHAPDVEVLPMPAIGKEPDAGTKVEAQAVLAGLCIARGIVRDNNKPCPDPGELTKCAREHCELDACVPQCGDFLACLEPSDDVCQAQYKCAMSDACVSCQSKTISCVLGFCADEIACASPVAPDGPCSQLEACCAMQGDAAEMCLNTVHLLETLSGDPSCYGAMMDWDANAHYAVPCRFK
jgi:hypothetical protein